MSGEPEVKTPDLKWRFSMQRTSHATETLKVPGLQTPSTEMQMEA